VDKRRVNPDFHPFYACYLARLESAKTNDNASKGVPEQRELFVGNVIQAAIENNLNVEGVVFPHDSYLDIGTPEDLVDAILKIQTAIRRNSRSPSNLGKIFRVGGL